MRKLVAFVLLASLASVSLGTWLLPSPAHAGGVGRDVECALTWFSVNHRCYAGTQVREAEERLSFEPFDPSSVVEPLTRERLRQVILVSDMSDVAVRHARAIYYVFGGVVGCPPAGRKSHYIYVDEAQGAIPQGRLGLSRYRTGCGQGSRSKWNFGINLSARSLALVIVSNFPEATVQSLGNALQRSASSSSTVARAASGRVQLRRYTQGGRTRNL